MKIVGIKRVFSTIKYSIEKGQIIKGLDIYSKPVVAKADDEYPNWLPLLLEKKEPEILSIAYLRKMSSKKIIKNSMK